MLFRPTEDGKDVNLVYNSRPPQYFVNYQRKRNYSTNDFYNQKHEIRENDILIVASDGILDSLLVS